MTQLQTFERWCNDIRDPANENNEGFRVVESGKARVRYWIARVPGGWAWGMDSRCPTGGTGMPWQGPEPTRHAALQSVVEHVQWLAAREYGQYAADFQRIAAQFAGEDMLGFIEPSPEPVRQMEEAT